MYKVILLSPAKKFYDRIFRSDRRVFERIDNCLQALKMDPFLGKPLKDNLKGKYSFRVGSYRIIYSVHKHEITVYVLDIGHRREIYQ